MPGKTETVEVAKDKIDKIVASPQFTPIDEPVLENNRRFFIFRWRGDQIEGYLGQRIVNYRRNSSYAIKLDNGEVFEIFGNKLLHTIIDQNELIGSKVRIIYIGYQKGPWAGRPRKIYRVFKIRPVITDPEVEMTLQKPIRKKQVKKKGAKKDGR